MGIHEHSEVKALSPTECRARLHLADTGHLAITSRALPLVIPVEVNDFGPELRITSLLADAVPLPDRSVVALEVGTFGLGRNDDWSVSVRGLLRRIRLQNREEAAVADFALSIELLEGWTRASWGSEQQYDEHDQYV